MMYLHRAAGGAAVAVVAAVRRDRGDAGARGGRSIAIARTDCRARCVSPASSDAGRPAPSICTLALSQVETNVALEAEVFRVDVPASTPTRSLSMSSRHARPGVREN